MMVPYRSSLYLVLLAGGVACGYAFLRPHEPVSVRHLVFQDLTGTPQPVYPAQSSSLNFETKTSGTDIEASSGALSPELQTTAAPTPSGAEDVALELQKELARAGCYRGVANGSWDQRSKNAMKELLDRVNARLPVDQPDPSLLALARHTTGLVCGGNQTPPSGIAAAATQTLSPVAIPSVPLDPIADRGPGPMRLGGPIMVPVGTIAQGEESVHSQAVTVVAPSAAQQTETAAARVRIRTSSRANQQYENRNLFRHPLGF